MKFPELTLFLGGESSSGCSFCRFVKVQRHIFEDNFYCFGVFFEHLLEQRLNFAAVRSLKIRKHNHGYRGILPAQKRCSTDVDILGERYINGCIGFVAVHKVEHFPAGSNVNGNSGLVNLDGSHFPAVNSINMDHAVIAEHKDQLVVQRLDKIKGFCGKLPTGLHRPVKSAGVFCRRCCCQNLPWQQEKPAEVILML